MVFGISRNIYLSIGTYMVIGMADQVSVVLRSTAVQLTTPDELRGRVSSVNSLFIGASNQLGAVESGLVAAATNATFAIVTGGIGCIAVVGVVWAKLPGLRNYVIERPRLVLEPAPGSAAPATASPGSDAASG
jgi:predicted MFS family arabinose efflux permease